ncbi:hypothetical protein LJ737_15980 [Hymenobacter sp. 15J16-1T3B]|uniref:hypothetical protein n=1 Tax=Hymenobacter sp. 15J16-1T3B TaxID=2886941 RepID=UPI001D126CBD|nr:hypothetical protein [Hymenobacter sp. 15J16-1T3B]MCC3158744.1 hypothetical protein [Hymenobacter sp. 15J16-1T3B]
MSTYSAYFANFFTTLPVSRVRFHALGTAVLTALGAAELPAAFDPHLAELQAALNAFDVDLAEAGPAPAGNSAAYRAARRDWLTFVDDTMKDYVTPHLRKQPAYADFMRHRKSRLAQLDHASLLRQSKQLLALYDVHHAALQYPALPADARAVFQQLTQADNARTITEAILDAARVSAAGDWQRLARALRRVKAQLELHFDEPAAVYRFFDFAPGRNYSLPAGQPLADATAA